MPRRFVAESAALYFTDNGAVLCGDHLGMTAKASGRDISGQKIEKVTPDDVRWAQGEGWTIKCEHCGRVGSLLHTSAA